MGKCSLCNKEKKLQKSHIIPKFVGKKLKSTSGTGFMRGGLDPSKRLQDFIKISLLCKSCEQRFSKLETYFANEIFLPFIEKRVQSFKYDDRLLKFVISLNWRTLVVTSNDFRQGQTKLVNYIADAEETWRKYLLGDSDDLGLYEHHIFFLDYVKEGEDLPDGFQQYTLRGVDVTLVGNEERVFVYSKFPSIIFVSSIYPHHLEGWQGTKIHEAGKISTPQEIGDGGFHEFLIDRAKLVRKTIEIASENIEQSILKSAGKDRMKFLRSESLEVNLAEAQRKRNAKKKKLPKLVGELVNIIEDSVIDPKLKLEEKQLRRLEKSMVLDTLVGISLEEALKLNSMLDSTMRKSKILNEDLKFTFEADELLLTFRVDQYCTKEKRHGKIEDQLKRISYNVKVGDKKYCIVFSFNPYGSESMFEMGFLVV